MIYQVVIVEDDPMVSMLNRVFTEKDPHFRVVQTFSDGKAALRWLTGHTADLLILDVYMPAFTGIELLRALRAQSSGIDVIMVTAANDAKTVDELFKLGVTDYLVKPFTKERFHQALNAFRLRREATDGNTSINQAMLDRLMSLGSDAHATPKGYQESTLTLIRDCLRSAPESGLDSEALAQKTGLSVVTVRRYVNHLAECGEVASTVKYDTGGRPCRLFRYLNPNKP